MGEGDGWRDGKPLPSPPQGAGEARAVVERNETFNVLIIVPARAGKVEVTARSLRLLLGRMTAHSKYFPV